MSVLPEVDVFWLLRRFRLYRNFCMGSDQEIHVLLMQNVIGHQARLMDSSELINPVIGAAVGFYSGQEKPVEKVSNNKLKPRFRFSSAPESEPEGDLVSSGYAKRQIGLKIMRTGQDITLCLLTAKPESSCLCCAMHSNATLRRLHGTDKKRMN